MTTTSAPLRRPTGFVPFRTPVRGHVFAARPPEAGAPAPGQRVALCREPHNPADPHAVAVWLDLEGRPWRIGYLAREVAARVAPRLDAGTDVEARVDGWAHEPGHRWQRPVLAVFPVPERFDPAEEPDASGPPTETGSGTRADGQVAVDPRRPRTLDSTLDAALDATLPARPARSLRRRVLAGGQSR